MVWKKFFKSKNIKFLRANVGDRYVKEKMQKYKFNLGGEQSVILSWENLLQQEMVY